MQWRWERVWEFYSWLPVPARAFTKGCHFAKVRLGRKNRSVNGCQVFLFFQNHHKRAASLVSSYKTTFLKQNQGALQSRCNPTTPERIVAAVGICLNSYSWYNFWCKLCTWYSFCTWYNLGTPPETRGSSQTVNSLSFAAALILTQGTKRTLTGPHFSEISSVLFEAQLSADSWLWKNKFTTQSIWLV